MSAERLIAIAAIVAAVLNGIALIIGALRVQDRLDQVHQLVNSAYSKALAQLAEALAELARRHPTPENVQKAATASQVAEDHGVPPSTS